MYRSKRCNGFSLKLRKETVDESINEDDNGRLLPGVGVGFRFTVSKETHMKIGMDIAKGSGDWGIYFRVGEAFNK